MLYSEPRFTKDLDLWVGTAGDNAARVFRALAEFGAPLSGVEPSDFAVPDLIYSALANRRAEEERVACRHLFER